MQQAKIRTFRLRHALALALAFAALALYSPGVMRAANAAPLAPPVPQTPSMTLGLDYICILAPPFCLTAVPCCANVFTVLDGDINTKQEVWMLNFWNGEMIIRLRQMTDMLVQAIMIQARMYGGFFDAQAQNATNLSLQRLQAEAMKDYAPDEMLCQFGSMSRSLAASEARGRPVKIALTERSQNRQLLNTNSNAANTVARGREPGRASDKAGRLSNFVNTYCSEADNNFVLRTVCEEADDDTRYNRDIDYARTFETPLTLDINFTDGGDAPDGQANLLALASNLYAHDVIANRPNPDELGTEMRGNATQQWMDYRSAVAKRSVAENSFASIAALKAPGEELSYTYMRATMERLGLAEEDIQRLLGTTTNRPSYYAQMEILGKRIYQDPAFYANLMQTPVNVQRSQAALGAIGLMQDRDITDSLMRSEMLLSTLLELQAIRAEERLRDKAAQ